MSVLDGDPAHWERVSALLNATLDRPHAERDAFLRSECGDDADLRERVSALLRADAQAGDSFMARPLFSLQPEKTVSEPGTKSVQGPVGAANSTRRLGPYRLLQRIGKGGMGAVYLAERVDGGFEQRVAIKVLKRGLESERGGAPFSWRAPDSRRTESSEYRPRFRRWLDARRLPYLVMEHVEGQRIDAFCASRRLGLRQRVRCSRRYVLPCTTPIGTWSCTVT